MRSLTKLIAGLMFAGPVSAQTSTTPGGTSYVPGGGGSGNATTINGASIPTSQACVGTNSSAQLISGSCGGSSAFSGLTSGTNTAAAMLVGTGASLGTTGSGTIGATSAPVAGITGLGSGIATFLATPTSANLAAAMTNQTGTGSVVFNTSPTLVTPVLGSATATTINGTSIPSSVTLSTVSGTPTTGHCVNWASSTSLGDAGAACGSGGALAPQAAQTVLSNATTSSAVPSANPTSTFLFPSTLSMAGAQSSTTTLLYAASVTLTGTPTVPSSGLVSPMSITLIDDALTGTGFANGLQVVDNIYTGTGGRNALFGAVNNLGSTACNQNDGCVGVTGVVTGTTNVGGTSGTTVGTFYGGNFQVYCNGTYFNVCNPDEDDISVTAAVGNKFGHTIVMLGTDTTQGTQNDIALAFLRQSGAGTSWKHIFDFSPNGLNTAIGSGTTLGSFTTPTTLTSGWDFSNATFTGYPFRSNGFAVSPAGAVTASGATISTFTGPLKGTAGVVGAASASDIVSLFSGTCSSTTVLTGNGTCSAGTPIPSLPSYTTPVGADLMVIYSQANSAADQSTLSVVQAEFLALGLRIQTAATATSITPTVGAADQVNQANTQATGTLTINNPTGTPTDGQRLTIRLTSTNVQTYSWGTAYHAGATALPTASTGGGKHDYIGFIYDASSSQWDYVTAALGY